MDNNIKEYGYPLAVTIAQWAKVLDERILKVSCPKILSYEVRQENLDKVLYILAQEFESFWAKLVVWKRRNTKGEDEYFVYFLMEDTREQRYVHGYNPNESLSIKTDTLWGKSIFSSVIAWFNKSFETLEKAQEYFQNEFELVIGKTPSSEGNLYILKTK